MGPFSSKSDTPEATALKGYVSDRFPNMTPENVSAFVVVAIAKRRSWTRPDGTFDSATFASNLRDELPRGHPISYGLWTGQVNEVVQAWTEIEDLERRGQERITKARAQEAERIEQAARQKAQEELQRTTEAARKRRHVCAMCGKSLGFIPWLLRAVKHKECSHFVPDPRGPR